MVLTNKEKQEIYIALSLRLSFIETGKAMIRAGDAIKSGQQKLIKPLSKEQRKLIVELEDLMERLLK